MLSPKERLSSRSPSCAWALKTDGRREKGGWKAGGQASGDEQEGLDSESYLAPLTSEDTVVILLHR